MMQIKNDYGELICFSATYKGKQISDDQIIYKDNTFTFLGDDLVIDFAQYSCCNFIIPGKNCVIYCGHTCTFTVGDFTVIKCYDFCKFILGSCCTVCCGPDSIFYSDYKKSTVVWSWYPSSDKHHHMHIIPQKKTVKLNWDGSLVNVPDNAMFTDIISTKG